MGTWVKNKMEGFIYIYIYISIYVCTVVIFYVLVCRYSVSYEALDTTIVFSALFRVEWYIEVWKVNMGKS